MGTSMGSLLLIDHTQRRGSVTLEDLPLDVTARGILA
jgi:hypothetical protein